MKHALPIWIIVILLSIFGYTYRAKINFFLSRIKLVRAKKDYRGPLNDSLQKHLENAQCLNKIAGSILPKETLDDLLDPTLALEVISTNNTYSLSYMAYSAPVLHSEAHAMLNEIGTRFWEEIKNQDLPKHKLRITSLTRSKNSQHNISHTTQPTAHWYGYSFSISYRYFYKINLLRADMDGNILKGILENILTKMREEKKILVYGETTGTYFTITLPCPSK